MSDTPSTASVAARAALWWLVLFAVMFANGTLRVVVLQPWLGEDRARQLASLTGVGIVLLVSRLFVRALPGSTSSHLLGVGLGWLAGTLAFEFLFGHFVSGLSWSALFADYDVRQGRLWPLVVVSVLLGPWIWGKLARRATGSSRRPAS